MLLASKWEAGFDLVRLLLGLVRVALMAMPDWVRYPVLALGGALLVYEVVTRGRTWWRARRKPLGES
ncbi:hypothetical protein ACIRSU_26280 [Streptomyces sp. NPDC101160]|uniref:hypothetical protein n=1 Tax=Streptomyces sp. NPDC101160 TaxID=3366118 RepID=UPI0038103791